MQHVTRYLDWYALCMLARMRWFTRITCCLLKHWLSFRWNLNRVIVLFSLIYQRMQYVDDYSSQTIIITAIYLLWDFYFKHTPYRHVIINNGMRLKNSFLFSVFTSFVIWKGYVCFYAKFYHKLVLHLNIPSMV